MPNIIWEISAYAFIRAFKPDNFCKHLMNSSESLLCVNGVWWDVFWTLPNIFDGPLTQKLLTTKRPKYFLIKTLSYMFHKALILRYGHLHILQFQQFQYKRKHCKQIYKKDDDSRWKVRIHQMKYPFNNGPPNQTYAWSLTIFKSCAIESITVPL